MTFHESKIEPTTVCFSFSFYTFVSQTFNCVLLRPQCNLSILFEKFSQTALHNNDPVEFLEQERLFYDQLEQL